MHVYVHIYMHNYHMYALIFLQKYKNYNNKDYNDMAIAISHKMLQKKTKVFGQPNMSTYILHSSLINNYK